ncbi:hypothetical protein BIY24_03790 [Halobacteriovorax marinus]|uniref:helix-turn-helix transcriptional regulator n=1 Tax=Halobacteriovorax marinus TaxID=97084 RepID=UPI000BC32351|nr:WYL domain-containing protein [Halobacteriovorax marinus]ATH07088.1 hypothetical protein BIY24_03790 [Halobacteriovorax marinus]
MDKITKQRRQELIFQILKGKTINDGLTANEVHKRLINEGLTIDLRTVRRDLIALTSSHGLCSDQLRPERYYPSSDYQLKYELHLNENTLQVLLIALNSLKFTSHDYFKNFATETETTIFNSLDSRITESLRQSKEKYFFDYSTAGKPASTNTKDFGKIMIAIRENKVITCNNESPYKSKEYNKRRRHFAPYLFILTSGTPYIIVQDQEDMKFKKLKATRVKNVHLSKKSFERIDLKEEINLETLVGGWGGISDKAIDITVNCEEQMATYFQERIIHPTQTVEKLQENSYKIRMRCAESSELARLFSSFGGQINSIEPESLYDDIKSIWNSGLKKVS